MPRCDVPADPLNYPLGGMPSVSVRIPGGRHGAAVSFVREQSRGVLDAGRNVGASLNRGASSKTVKALRGLTHN